MIKLMSLKKQKSGEASTEKENLSSPSIPAAERRVQKDLTELDLPKTITLQFPHKDDVMTFEFIIVPDEGFYKGGSFLFTCQIPETYPHDPPKVRCSKCVFHPNIDPTGNICLNILREDWKPVLSLSSILIGLQFLFLEPNAEDPLNKEAAQVLKTSPCKFSEYVKRSMRGEYLNGVQYDNVQLSSRR